MESYTNLQPSQWLTEKKVASITGLSLSTLQKHRFYGRGIAYSKIGRAVRYREADVISFMESKKVIPAGNGGISPRA